MLLLVVALGLRVVFVPMHLASEEHTGGAGTPLLPRVEQHVHGMDHGHHQGRHVHHDQDGEHDSHPAADHQSELISLRVAGVLGKLPSASLPVVSIHLAAPQQERLAVLAPTPPPPESRTPSASHSRGPPAVV
ncbi:MAG: hypothetical protein ACI8QC_001962 [Planctomycetota bacterium]|jgi:hypothetical protein